MKTLTMFASLILTLLVAPATAEVPPLLNYQGRVSVGATPFAGPTGYFKFALVNADASQTFWRNSPDANSNGEPDTAVALNVSKGLYAVLLGDASVAGMASLPPSIFANNSDVRLRVWFSAIGPTTGFERLIPDQRITSVGYALATATADQAKGVDDGAISTAKLANAAVTAPKIGSAQVVKSLNALKDSVTLAGGANVTVGAAGNTLTIAANAWGLTGNAGTTPGVNFLGTTDDQAFELMANNTRVLRLEPNATSPNVVAGWKENAIDPGVYGSTISGGGVFGIFGAIYSMNRVTDHFGVIGGGAKNIAGNQEGGPDDAIFATVSGGYFNYAGANFSTVGGGAMNFAHGDNATISGGELNGTEAGGATVGGGRRNHADGDNSTVGGGRGNLSSGFASTVSGGEGNAASGLRSTVGGGYLNAAKGWYSFAAGFRAQANHDRSFIWSSYQNDAPTFGTDTFFVSARNGIGINCGEQRADGGGQYWLNLGNVIGNDLMETSVGAHLTTAGVWANASDKNRKNGFADVNPREILDKLVALPIQTWRYTNEPPALRHLGPVAQDFHAAFGLGSDDKSIGTVDADGVAFAAIQGLNRKLENQMREKDARIVALEQAVAELKALMTGLAHLKESAP